MTQESRESATRSKPNLHRLQEASSLFDEAITAFEADGEHGCQQPDWGTLLHNWGASLSPQNRWVEAARAFRKALAVRRGDPVMGDTHPSTLNTLNKLVVAMGHTNEMAEVEALLATFSGPLSLDLGDGLTMKRPGAGQGGKDGRGGSKK